MFIENYALQTDLIKKGIMLATSQAKLRDHFLNLLRWADHYYFQSNTTFLMELSILWLSPYLAA